VTLDESVTRNISVTPYIIGDLAPGFEIRKIVVDPSSVSVSGAKTEIARLSILRTDPVDISGLNSTISQNVRLDANGKNVRTQISDVSVRVVIGRKSR